jgi:hypothetical protein
MIVVETKSELRKIIDRSKEISLVMTMGALHEGHIELIKAAKNKAEQVVVSIFVNPLQFGINEDYNSYPRKLDADLQICESNGVDIVFAPSVQQMYSDTRQISLKVGALSQVYEGSIRPGHFDGVCQIVCKMFNLVKPNYAFFGQKDAQQLAVIRNMVEDLDMSVQICAVPIKRNEKGLALSSRNAYLSDAGKILALQIYKSLEGARDNLLWGMEIKQVQEIYSKKLEETKGIDLDYFAIVDPYTFLPANNSEQKLIICAAKVEGTRLIDNLLVG